MIQEPPENDTPNSIDEHEQRIRDLARMNTDDPKSFESLLDNADSAYTLAHEAGMMRNEDGNEEPFVGPSIKREQLYQESLRQTPRPVEIASMHVYERSSGGYNRSEMERARELSDPLVGMMGSDMPVGILENINDNDSMGNGSYRISWLGCSSLEEAIAYCDEVGWEHSKPGPGEDDGVYTNRTIYDNPRFLDQKNAGLGEVDDTSVELAIEDILTKVGLDPNGAETELKIIKGLSRDVGHWNGVVKEGILSRNDRGVAKLYYNHRLRERSFAGARGAMDRQIQLMTSQIAESMGYDKPPALDKEELEHITSAATTITDALKTRHELREVTIKTLQTVLQGFIKVGHMRTHAAEVFKTQGSEEEEKRWTSEVGDVLVDTVSQINESYSVIMQRYIDTPMWSV